MEKECLRTRLLYAFFLLLLALLAAFTPLGQRVELGGRGSRTAVYAVVER